MCVGVPGYIDAPCGASTGETGGERSSAMPKSRWADGGFTLVELMVVVLIIGVLVTIAAPVYQASASNAESKACMANQRTISSAVGLYLDGSGVPVGATPGQLDMGGTSWYAVLIPDWVKSKPTCPFGHTNYVMDAAGNVTGDKGAAAGFNDGHSAP